MLCFGNLFKSHGCTTAGWKKCFAIKNSSVRENSSVPTKNLTKIALHFCSALMNNNFSFLINQMLDIWRAKMQRGTGRHECPLVC